MRKKINQAVILLWIVSSVNSYAQTTYLSNGSFEVNSVSTQNGDLFFCPGYVDKPNSYYYAPNILNEILQKGHEVGRCLGKWYGWEDYTDWTDIELPQELPGWYSPTGGTADYFRNPANCSFYTPSGIYKDYAAVPVNYYNWEHKIYVNGRLTQVQQWPYSYDKDETQKAYCGIILYRKLSNTNTIDVDHTYNKNEYLQKKLDTPLQAYTWYKVTFYVSRGPRSTPGVSFKLKGIEVYFSNQPLIISCNTGTQTPQTYSARPILKENDPTFQLDKMNFISYNSGIYYRDNPNHKDEEINTRYVEGSERLEWVKMEGYVCPTNTIYYLTIGNFNLDWFEKDEIVNHKDQNTELHLMYYIDNIQIELWNSDEPCVCISNMEFESKSGIDIELRPKLKEPSATQCCYEVFLKFKNDPSTCKVTEVNVYNIEINPPVLIQNLTKQSAPNPFFWAEEVKIGEYCFDNSQINQPMQFKFSYKLYNTTEICEEFYSFNQQCYCDCGTEPNYNSKLYLDFISDENGLCCYNVNLVNLSENCSEKITKIKFSSDDIDFKNIFFTSGRKHQLLWNEYKAVFEFFGDDQELHPSSTYTLCKLCVPSNTAINDLEISYVTGLDFFETECKENTVNLFCNCCDFIAISTVPPEKPISMNGFCCYDIQVQLIQNTCSLTKAIIYDITNPENPLFNGNIPQNNMLNLYDVCVPDLTPNPSMRVLQFIFKDGNDNIICDKQQLQLTCGEEYGQGNHNSVRVNNNFLKANVIPNPAKEKIFLSFEQINNSFVSIDLFDNNGRLVSRLFNKQIAHGIFSEEFEINNLATGVYFICISDNINNHLFLTFSKH